MWRTKGDRRLFLATVPVLTLGVMGRRVPSCRLLGFATLLDSTRIPPTVILKSHLSTPFSSFVFPVLLIYRLYHVRHWDVKGSSAYRLNYCHGVAWWFSLV
jgi:hypothetical protein